MLARAAGAARRRLRAGAAGRPCKSGTEAQPTEIASSPRSITPCRTCRAMRPARPRRSRCRPALAKVVGKPLGVVLIIAANYPDARPLARRRARRGQRGGGEAERARPANIHRRARCPTPSTGARRPRRGRGRGAADDGAAERAIRPSSTRATQGRPHRRAGRRRAPDPDHARTRRQVSRLRRRLDRSRPRDASWASS